jgi:hypothetical protein
MTKSDKRKIYKVTETLLQEARFEDAQRVAAAARESEARELEEYARSRGIALGRLADHLCGGARMVETK